MKYEDWKEQWETLVDKFADNGFNSLDSNERIWFNVRVLIDSVDNGGIISFYYNSGADYLQETMEDLSKIGADNISNLLVQVNQLFPGGKPSKDIDERNAVIDEFDYDDGELEELLQNLDDEFYSLEEELEAKLEPTVLKIISR